MSPQWGNHEDPDSPKDDELKPDGNPHQDYNRPPTGAHAKNPKGGKNPKDPKGGK
ncbi:hypothetical protein [Spongiactinospora gelatinilytica]|uniref:hypothetical protein n=1 Tax=Spongiactinospora gelatinilytica TaxID=2666298 RepID=UPI00131462CB|nr:hypothetical protein [Spongiactinospora gelatinilytica]